MLTSLLAGKRSAWWPGLLLAITVATAASYLAERLAAPRILCALLLGMGFNFMLAQPGMAPGLDFASKRLLRIGIALLGARIGFTQVRDLGLAPLGIVLAAVGGTLLCGWLIAKAFKRPVAEGLLTGGAVAICGASAALALAAVMPQTARHQRFTLLTVVGVTSLSTVAMVLYPLLAQWLVLSPTEAAIFLGGSIHDVAQVVGAGLMVSPQVGEGATLVKLIRVSLLVPVALLFAHLFRAPRASRQNACAGDGASSAASPPLLPGFLVAFLVLVGLNSLGMVPHAAVSASSDLSQWLIVIAIAALGAKTSPRQLLELGWAPVIMLVIESLCIAGWVLGGIFLAR